MKQCILCWLAAVGVLTLGCVALAVDIAASEPNRATGLVVGAFVTWVGVALFRAYARLTD